MMNLYPVTVKDRYQIPSGIALSPVEETLRSYEDISSLFSVEMDSAKTLTTPQSPSAVFSAGDFGDPRPPEVDNDTLHTDLDADHLFLDVLISEFNTKEAGLGAQESTPLVGDGEISPLSSEAPSPLTVSSTPLECTNMTGNCDPLDNPLLTNDFDITELLSNVQASSDPTLSTTCSPYVSPVLDTTQVDDSTPQFDLSDCLQLFPHLIETSPEVLLTDMFPSYSTPVSDELTSEPEPITPLSTSPSAPTTPQPDEASVKNSRKRSASDIEADDPPVKKSKVDKQVLRRVKNNAASRVSRAKRKERHNNVFSRVEELEEENARLRVQANELEVETTKLKKLLVEKLSKQA